MQSIAFSATIIRLLADHGTWQFCNGGIMSERNGTANLLAQVTAFRELKEDYGTDVAESLTAKNLQRNGVDASTSDVKGWDKVNNAALQGQLDIPVEVVIAEEKAAVAAGTALNEAAQNVPNQSEPISNQADEDNDDEDEDEDDDADLPDDENELSTVDEIYGYDDPEDNLEAAYDDVLKAQENS